MAQGKVKAHEKLEEEQRLSNCVYFGLYALTQAHKPTKDFEKVFQKDLFLKTNTNATSVNAAALPHVLHFLFTIYNPEEFRKRFYWPFYNDREAEKTFRNACMKYLQELNEQFNLRMEDITTHTMLFPGGLKFLKIMDKFITFVTIEELKKTNSSDILDTMSITLGNRMLQRVSNQRDAIDGLYTDKMNSYATEQEKMNKVLQAIEKKFQILAEQRNVLKDELLSEEYQSKKVVEMREKFNEFNTLVNNVRQYNSSVEAFEIKVENCEKPIISSELTQRTQRAADEIFRRFPHIHEDLREKTLKINDRVSAEFVLKLGGGVYPPLIALLKEEWAKRQPTLDTNIETMNNLAGEIDQLSMTLKQRTSENANNLLSDVTEMKNNLTDTPSFKSDSTVMVNYDKSRLLYHDDDNKQLQMSQLQKLMYNSVRSTKSSASSTFSSMQTVKKPGGNSQIEALSVLAHTQKRPKSKKKFTNYTHLGALPTKWMEDVANFSTVSSPGLDTSAQSSKFSIDGHLPLGSSSMIAGGTERPSEDTNGCFKYKFNNTPAALEPTHMDMSPSGRLTSPLTSEKLPLVPKFVIAEGIPEEGSFSTSKDSECFGAAAAEVEESLFNISDGVLKDID